MVRRLPILAILLTAALWGAPARAQSANPPPDPPAGQSQAPPPQLPPDLTTDLSRIREGLQRPDSLRVRQEGVRFYMEVIGRRIPIHEYLRNSDLRNAPVPRAGITHQDFLNHITPKLLYSSGGIKARELLEWGIVNWLGQMAVKKIFSEVSDAMREAEIRRIREQIDRELAALKGKGGG
jgi:hypothetical protein